jgi:hypothetical protein
MGWVQGRWVVRGWIEGAQRRSLCLATASQSSSVVASDLACQSNRTKFRQLYFKNNVIAICLPLNIIYSCC